MTQQPTETDRMLTVHQVCEQLAIGKSKYYELVRAGELAAINVNPAATKRKVGERGPRRSIRVAQSEVDEFKRRNQLTG